LVNGGFAGNKPKGTPAPPAVSGFFEQLPLCGVDRFLIVINESANRLEGKVFDTKAILFNHNDVSVFGRRDNIYPIGSLKHYSAKTLSCTGMTHLVVPDIE